MHYVRVLIVTSQFTLTAISVISKYNNNVYFGQIVHIKYNIGA